MRITYLHQYFITPEMSGGTRSYEMARRLVAKGHEVHMITSWQKDDDKRKGWFDTEEAGIRVHWLPVPYSNNMGYRERIRAFFRFAWAAARKAASIPTDMVFATSTPLTIALPGAYAKWRRKVPMVFEVRDLWPELPIAIGALNNPFLQAAARQLENFAYRSSTYIVALSPGMRDGVCRTGFPEDRVLIIPNSSDLNLFNPLQARPDRFLSSHPELLGHPLVLYMGTLGTINGVDYLSRIAAAARDMQLDMQFAVVGSGKMEAEVRTLADKLGVLGENFHLYPPVSKAKTADALAAADIALSLFVDLEPMWANSANKFFDALASATPVAINYGGWQAEILHNTGAGIQLPSAYPEEAARQLGAFLADSERMATAQNATKRLAEEHFNRDKLADELEAVLLKANQTDAGQ